MKDFLIIFHDSYKLTARFSFLYFVNKIFQTQHERNENSQLRTDNEKLRAENMRYKEALTNASCPNCGGPASLGEMSFDEHHLRIENARLREEVLVYIYIYNIGIG